MLNNICYKYEKYTYEKFLFKNINATYIIHLEGNNRLKNIKKQISEIHLTKELYILYNKGYKNCKKDKYINKASFDLIDAFIQIFKNAKEKNYDNILILEDDFIFDNNIFDINVRYNIDNFLKRSYNNEYIYYFGCIPYLQIKTFNYHNLLLLSTGTHACIYPKKFINNIIKINQKKIIDWDIFLNLNYKRYCYYKPICYQLFPETENKKSWNNTLYLSYFIKYLLLVLKLDKKIEPGYTIMYNFSILFFYILLLILVILIYIIKFKMY